MANWTLKRVQGDDALVAKLMRVQGQPVVLPVPFCDNMLDPRLYRGAGVKRFVVHRPVGVHIVPNQHRSGLRTYADFDMREFGRAAVLHGVQKYHRGP